MAGIARLVLAASGANIFRFELFTVYATPGSAKRSGVPFGTEEEIVHAARCRRNAC